MFDSCTFVKIMAQQNKSDPMKMFQKLKEQHEERMQQLEREIYECVDQLQQLQAKETRTAAPSVNCEREVFSWHYDMSKFALKNIALRLKRGKLYLHAHREHQGRILKANREVHLPEQADSLKLEAHMSAEGILTISAPKKSLSKNAH